MSQSYSYKAIVWGGQGPSPTTGHIQADAGSGKRTAANRARAKSKREPLIGQTHTTSDFELVSNMTSALLAGDSQAAIALVNLGSHAAQSAIATGRLAARGRRR
jgi:hypothetical protein